MTHKDRVHEFNQKLEALSEHHDIPKVCGLNPLVRARTNGVFPHRLDPDNDPRRPCLGFLLGTLTKHARTLSLGVTYAFLPLITTMSNTLAMSTSHRATSHSHSVFRERDGGSHDRNLPSCSETPPSPLSPIMSPAAVDFTTEKKGHICPPSNASHPCNRWECLFVYAFICKFTNLRGKIDGLNSAVECVRSGFVSFAILTPPLIFFPSFEEALLSTDPNPILTQILARFVLNLRPLTRNLRCVHAAIGLSTVLNVSTSLSYLQLGPDLTYRRECLSRVPQNSRKNSVLER